MTSSSPGDWRSSFGYGPGQQAGSLTGSASQCTPTPTGHTLSYTLVILWYRPNDALTREGRQNCARFAYLGPQVDRLHVLELKRDVE